MLNSAEGGIMITAGKYAILARRYPNDPWYAIGGLQGYEEEQVNRVADERFNNGEDVLVMKVEKARIHERDPR